MLSPVQMVYVEQRYRGLARNIDLLRRALAVQRCAHVIEAALVLDGQ